MESGNIAIVSKRAHFPYTLHFSRQARIKNLETDWDLVVIRDSDVFLYYFDNQAIILSLSFLYVFVLQKHSYWRVKAMILGGKSYDIAA